MGEVDIKDHKVKNDEIINCAQSRLLSELPQSMEVGWLNVDQGSRKVYRGEVLAHVGNGKAPHFQGESKGLLWLEEELGLPPD